MPLTGSDPCTCPERLPQPCPPSPIPHLAAGLPPCHFNLPTHPHLFYHILYIYIYTYIYIYIYIYILPYIYFTSYHCINLTSYIILLLSSTSITITILSILLHKLFILPIYSYNILLQNKISSAIPAFTFISSYPTCYTPMIL